MGKRIFTEAEKQAARERDAAIRARAAEAMEDEDTTDQLAEMLTTAPSLSRYSTRNQVFILVQAAEREIPVTEVRSLGEWRKNGRRVRRGEHGLRIWAPLRKNKQEQGQAEEAKNDPASSTKARADVKGFKLVSVFDRSQTEPADDTPDTEAAPAAPTPRRALIDARVEELRSMGYEVSESDDPGFGAVAADHDAQEVHVSAAEDLTDAEVLAGLIRAAQEATARKDRERAEVPQPRTASAKPVRLAI